MNSQSTGTQLHSNPCTKCGSRSWQSIEMAYLQSLRTTNQGNQSISSFGASISPPQPRSTIGGPIWSAFGIFCTGLIFVPYVNDHAVTLPGAATAMFDPAVYIPAFIFGVIAFFVHLGSALNYNESHWAQEYVDWQSRFICRTCGHQSPAETRVSRGDVR